MVLKRLTEPRLFVLVVVLNMLPILLFRFFPTMDGAAHLYNSNLIKELLFGSQSTINEYFAINPEPVPNWLSHFILAMVGSILPAWLAEKTLLILYFVLLPLSFRTFVKVYNKPWLSYLIFPFTYSFLFYIGFYNFCLSFIILFYTISYWIQSQQKNSVKFWLILCLLINFSYLSHIIVYAFLLFTLFILLSQQAILHLIEFQNIRETFAKYLKKYFLLFATALPSLVLFAWFFVKRGRTGENLSLENSVLFEWIKDIRPIIALSYNPELRLTEVLYHLFVGLVAILFYNRIQHIEYSENQSVWSKIKFTITNGLFIKKDVFLGISLLILLILFNFPNSAGAGMMSDRFALLFFIFFISWLAIQVFPNWIYRISIIIVLGINFGFVYRYILATNELNKIVEPIYQTAKFIEPNSTVIPINYSEHWLSGHFSNYLGVDKPIIILENYEADVGWFPVCWQKNMPRIALGNLEKDSTCVYWRNVTNKQVSKKADYVFIFGKNSNQAECNAGINNELYDEYKLVYNDLSANILLYKLKIENE